MNYDVFIFARGGSKGLPGKNIRDLCGQPLIVHSIKLAKKLPKCLRVYVSTDDKDIATVSSDAGADVIDRPANLAKDDSVEWEAWRHAINHVYGQNRSDALFISLPPTAPLRSSEDVDNAINRFARKDVDICIGVTESARNPFFNMVKIDNKGHASLFAETDKPYFRRQDAPQAFDVSTVVYVSSLRFIRENIGVFSGKVGTIIVPPERALDIDTLFDFKQAEMLMKSRRIVQG